MSLTWSDRDLPPLELATAKPSFSYLGPLECQLPSGAVEIKGSIARALLATLLVAQWQPVSVDALLEELWPDNPPAKAENALQAQVSRLRRKLAVGGHVAVLSSPTHYRLVAPAAEVDATTFTRLCGAAQSLQRENPDKAAHLLRAALAYWRGPVFGSPLGGPLCQAAAARLKALRSTATELLYDIELRRGRHNEVIPELSAAVASPELHERFCEQLMVALYRSGRQAQALDVYRQVRDRLDTELGIAPSPSMRAHEQAVLAHDPSLRVGGDHTVVGVPAPRDGSFR